MKKQILTITIILTLLGAILIGINLNCGEDSTKIRYEFFDNEYSQKVAYEEVDNSIGEVYRAEKSKSKGTCPLAD